MTAAAREQRDGRVEEDGRAWADSVRALLSSEGRAAAGGWPGTLSEARVRLESVMRTSAKPTADERDRLARLLYNAARSYWLVHREAAMEPDEDDSTAAL